MPPVPPVTSSATGPSRPPTPADWRPVARSKAYELVVERIEEQILTGALRVGDILPAERDLAERLQVSRAAVREAIRTLEAQGAMRSSVGAGAGAGTQVAAMPSEALTKLLRLHVALSNFPMADVVEARVMLECSSARLAALNADDRDLAGMREPLEGMEAAGDDQTVFNDRDTAFHVALAEAARNRLVTDMTIAIRESMKSPILRAFRALEEPETLRRRLQAEHRAIYEAVASGDPDRAAAQVEAHIRGAHASLPSMSARPGAPGEDPAEHTGAARGRTSRA